MTNCNPPPRLPFPSPPCPPLARLQDGVYPEKVNAGRQGANGNMRRIGQNPTPAQVKFSGKIPAEF